MLKVHLLFFLSSFKTHNNKYYITTGNSIENDNILKLEELLKKVNSLDHKDLKIYYQEI